MSEMTVNHNAERQRFELLDAGKVVGKAEYREYSLGAVPQRIFYHTVVNDEYGGQGLGATLATAALDATVSEGIGVVPVCPFIRKFLRRHSEYAASVTAVTPDHLTFLESALNKA